MKFFVVSLAIFATFLSKIDRLYFKASHGFCLHFIEADIPFHSEWETDQLPPKDIFNQPFIYLAKGAQSFVFSSQDNQYVLKLYRFPSHMRKFGWLGHPFGYLFTQKRQEIERKNIEKFRLSFNSYYLAHQKLKSETGVVYLHLNHSTHLNQKISLVDRSGYRHVLPLDQLRFVVQKKGSPFLPQLQDAIAHHQIDTAKKMIDSLVQLIYHRWEKGIVDLDNFANDNYGWLEEASLHLDIGRFIEKKGTSFQDEFERVVQPLSDYLENTSEELFDYLRGANKL